MAHRKPPAHRRGAAIIEAAVSLGLFLTLLFGVIEVSRVWMTYHLLTVAVREGARLAAVTPGLAANDDIRVTDRMDQLLQAGGVRTATRTVNVTGQQVTVRASISFTPVVGLVFNLPSIPLDAKVVARHE